MMTRRCRGALGRPSAAVGVSIADTGRGVSGGKNIREAVRVKWIAIVAVAALACAGNPVRADDAATSFARIFSDVCLAKFGHLDAVDDWAADQDLRPITNPQALAVFAGRANMDGTMVSVAGGGVPGSGKAWAVHDTSGRFVLATRLDPESCVVWAQKADPGAVETAYANMVQAASTPGTNVKLVEDKNADIPDGQVHIRVYRVWSGSAMNSLALVMAAVNRAGGPFQAMLETQRVFDRDEAINPMVPLEPPN